MKIKQNRGYVQDVLYSGFAGAKNWLCQMGKDDSLPQPKIKSAEVLRTARSLFHGQVLVPASIWDGKQ